MILPRSLMIIAAILVIQVILFLVSRKKKRKLVLLTMLPVIGIGIWQGLYQYNRTNTDLSKVKADVKISATALINEFRTSDSAANLRYLGRIIELTGRVNEIENTDEGNYTIVLGEEGDLSTARCIMDTLHTSEVAGLTEGLPVTIRAAYTGYKKNELLGENLGSDVEFNRAVIIKNK